MSQQTEAGPAPLVHTVEEAAKVLRCSRNGVYDAISAGRLKSFTQGRRRRIAHTDLVAFVNAMRKDAEPKAPRATKATPKVRA